MDLAELGFKIDTSGIKKAADDLDKMGRESRRATDELTKMGASSESVSRRAVSGAGGMGRAMTSLIAIVMAAAAAIAYATSKTLDFAKTLNNATAALNTNSEALQIWMRGAQSLGIEGDKMRDIFKDINDKLGELSLTGSGEAKDAFDALGLKIRDFQGLKADQSLLKIGEAMRQSSLTGAQKTTVLEMLADDLSLLMPLLTDGGKKLKDINDLAVRSGALINQRDLSTLNSVNIELSKISTAWDGLVNETGIAGAELFSSLGISSAITDSIIGFKNSILSLKKEASFISNVWSDASKQIASSFPLLGEYTDKYFSALSDISSDYADFIRKFYTYLPIWAKAAFDATYSFAGSTFKRIGAGMDLFRYGWTRLMSGIVSLSASAFKLLTNGMTNLVSGVLDSIATSIKATSDALSNIPGMEDLSQKLGGVSDVMRGVAQSAITLNDDVYNSLQSTSKALDDTANSYKDSAELALKQADAMGMAGMAALTSAAAYQANAEKLRENSLASHALATGYDVAAAAAAQATGAANVFIKTTYELKKAEQGRYDTLKSVTEEIATQRVRLLAGDHAAQYMTESLSKLSRAEAEAAGKARQYNTYLEERDRLNMELDKLGAGIDKTYAIDLKVKGLDKPFSVDQATINLTNSLIREQDRYTKAVEDSAKAVDQWIKKLQDVADSAANATRHQFTAQTSTAPAPASINSAPAPTATNAVLATQSSPQIKPTAIDYPALTKSFKDATAPFLQYIQAASHATGVDAALIRAVIQQETGYLRDPNRMARAVSPKGAGGVSQFLVATGQRYGISSAERFDPEKAIMAEAKYLRDLLKMFNGNVKLVAAGYNAGEGAVKRYGTVPPYKETKKYAKNVSEYFEIFKGAKGAVSNIKNDIDSATKSISASKQPSSDLSANINNAAQGSSVLNKAAESLLNPLDGAQKAAMGIGVDMGGVQQAMIALNPLAGGFAGSITNAANTPLAKPIYDANGQLIKAFGTIDAVTKQYVNMGKSSAALVDDNGAISTQLITIQQEQEKYNSLLMTAGGELNKQYTDAQKNELITKNHTLEYLKLVKSAEDRNAELSNSPAIYRAIQLEQLKLSKQEQASILTLERRGELMAEQKRLTEESLIIAAAGNKRKEYEQGLRQTGWYSESDIGKNGMDYAANAAARLAQETRLATIEAQKGKEAFRAWELQNIEGFSPSMVGVQLSLEKAQQQAERFREVYDSVMSKTEEALLSTIMTGKGDWSGLINYMIEEAMRLYVIKPLLNGLFGGGSNSGGLGGVLSMVFGGGRATGGAVSAGQIYEINERGTPELYTAGGRQYLMPTQNGNVQALNTAPQTGVNPMKSTAPVQVNVKHEVINNTQAQVKTESQDDGRGNITIKTIIENVESGIAERMSLGKGLAPMLDRRYMRAR